MDFQENIINILIYLFLIICSIQDIKEKRLSKKLLAGFGMLFFIVSFLMGNISFSDWIWNMLPGMAAILTAFLTKEQIGYGDGICLLILGNVNSFDVLLGAMMGSLIVMSGYSIILLLLKKGNRKTTLPMLPFLTAGMAFQTVLKII